MTFRTRVLLETANLLSLAMLIVIAALTNLWLLAATPVLEVAYLIWASPHYDERLQQRQRENPDGIDVLDQCLFVVAAAATLVMLFFGFGKHLMSNRWFDMSHAAGWEAGALWASGLFLIYYAFKFILGTREIKGDKAFPRLVLAVIALTGIFSWSWYKAYTSIEKPAPLQHVGFVLLLGCCFCGIDALAMRFDTEEEERALSRGSFWSADFPMVAAFVVLGAYLWCHHDAEHQDVFVSGVISCQLVVSNVLFIVMEFGYLKIPAMGVSRTAGDTTHPTADLSAGGRHREELAFEGSLKSMQKS